MWTSPELEAASALLHLPDLVRNFSPGIPDVLHWATKKRRSVPITDQQLQQQPISVKVRECNKAGGNGMSSPTNPLSFEPSREEGENGAGAAPAVESRPAAAAAATKNAKQHNEWVKQQNQTIASLSASIVNLERAVAEAKGRQQKLKAKNASLREMRTKALASMPKVMQQQPGNNNVDPSGFRSHSGATVVPVGMMFVPLTMPNKRIADYGRMVPDLNARAEEYEEAVMRMDMAAATAQARKRRMEKNRERAQRVKRVPC